MGVRTATGSLTGPPVEEGPSSGQRRSRSLSDKVLITFHVACDVREFEIARQLLVIME